MMAGNTRNSLIAYIHTFLLIFLSGSIYGIGYYYKETVFVVLTFTVIVLLKHYKLSVNKNAAVAFMTLAVLVIIVPLVNNVDFSSYIAVILQMLIAFLFTSTYSVSAFKRVFCKIMIILSVISLFCFSLYLIYPRIALIFPKTEGVASLDYYNAGLYVFASSKGYGYFVPFYRNMGIFWEPGCYQSFLNLSLFFHLDEMDASDYSKKRYNAIVTSILILTIITTFSTTGVIVLCLLVICFNAKIRQIFSLKKTAILLLISIVLCLWLISYNITFFVEKIQREFSLNGSALDRLGLVNLKLIIQEPLSIMGLSFERYEQLCNSIVGNSLVQALISLGLPFSLLLTWMYGRFANEFERGWLIFTILFIFFSVESLIWRPIFLCLAWYGFSGEQLKKHENDLPY